MDMFCYQCQETAGGTGCTKVGVCGKKPEVANLQDLLIYNLKGISMYNLEARKLGLDTKKADHKIIEDLFATITNANFDRDVFIKLIKESLALREEVKASVKAAGGKVDFDHDSANWTANTVEEFDTKSHDVGVLSTENEDVRSLRELTIYGLKGMAAYAEHARNLKHESDDIYRFIQKALVDTTNDSLTVDELVALVLETGKYGVDVMALLDKANADC